MRAVLLLPLCLIVAACTTTGGFFSSRESSGILSFITPKEEVLRKQISGEVGRFQSSEGTSFSLTLQDLNGPQGSPQSWDVIQISITEVYDPLQFTALGLPLPPGGFAGGLRLKATDHQGHEYALRSGRSLTIKAPGFGKKLDTWSWGSAQWSPLGNGFSSDQDLLPLGVWAPGQYKEGPQPWSGWLFYGRSGTKETGKRHPFTGILIYPFQIISGPLGDVVSHRSLSAYSGDPADTLVQVSPGTEVKVISENELALVKGALQVMVSPQDQDFRMVRFPGGYGRFTWGAFRFQTQINKNTEISVEAGSLEVHWDDGITDALGPEKLNLGGNVRDFLTRTPAVPWFYRLGPLPLILEDQGFGGNTLILNRRTHFAPTVELELKELNQWVSWTSASADSEIHSGAPLRDLKYAEPMKDPNP